MPDGARFVHGDIRDAAAVGDALAGVDCVFHLAAQVTIRGSFDRFYEDLDTNVMGTAHGCCATSIRRAVKLVRARLVDGASTPTRPSPVPIDETHPTEPLSPYGIGKLAAERRGAAGAGGARHSVHGVALFQHLRSGTGLHAVRRRASRSS